MNSNPEPRYIRLRWPTSAWPVIRLASVTLSLAFIVLLLLRPATGLSLFWGALVPVLPAVFLIAPGLWRNVCPMASVNQVPRVLGFSLGLRLPDWLARHGFAIGAVAFFALSSSRVLGWDENAQALAVMVGGALALPLLGGLLFRGKSGFCGSICPLRPMQGLYGQSPMVRVQNSHCRPCVGCSDNCPDLKPAAHYPDAVRDEEAGRGPYRRLFAGAFPGFVLAFYTMPLGVGVAAAYGRFGLFMLVSLGLFFLVASLVGGEVSRVARLWGATGFGAFYWFNVPVLFGAAAGLVGHAGHAIPEWALWEGRIVALSVVLWWIVRASRRDRAARGGGRRVERRAAAAGSAQRLPLAGRPPAPEAETSLEPDHRSEAANAPPRVAESDNGGASSPRPLAGDPPVPVPDRRSRARRTRQPEVTVMPEGREINAVYGSTLLEVAQAGDVEIEPGCRMGLCGCDPVYVFNGSENLSPVGTDERATIERLGLPSHSRMACVARVLGDVVMSLEPVLPPAPPTREESSLPGVLTANGSGAAALAGSSTRSLASPSELERVVIIGNGIAGVTAADHIRRHHSDCQIDMVTDERHPFYNRTSVSRLIHARTGMRRMHLLPDSWYDERRITSWLNTSVTSIDREAKHATLGMGDVLAYDRLVIATGSSASIPPIRGFGVAGSFSVRQADDAMRIRAYAQRRGCRRAVIAGGGVLGLEAADALRQLGLEVTVVERSDWLAPAQLDARGGKHLHNQVELRGIATVLGASIAAIGGEDSVDGVELDDGSVLEADLVLVCAGITPNTTIAREAGLEVNRGVVVDDLMRTSDPDIFAAGDVAEHEGRVYGLWPSALEQAEVAAMNLVGASKTYEGSVMATHLKVAGLDLTSIGHPHSPPEGGFEIALEEAEAGRYRKLVISEDRIVGAILLGYPSDAAAVLASIKEHRDVRGHLEDLRAGDWHVLNEFDFEEAVAASIAGYRPDSYPGEDRTAAEPPEPETSSERAPANAGGHRNGNGNGHGPDTAERGRVPVPQKTALAERAVEPVERRENGFGTNGHGNGNGNGNGNGVHASPRRRGVRSPEPGAAPFER